MSVIKSDILIIGAGPVGLFTVFEAGLLGLKCHLIDALAKPGGQCSEIYPKKPIYDIPGMPEILAGDLVDNLLEQIKPFSPSYTLGERAEKLIKKDDGSFDVVTNTLKVHNAKVVAIAGGLGSFEPRKPPIKDIEKFEKTNLFYSVKDKNKFKDHYWWPHVDTGLYNCIVYLNKEPCDGTNIYAQIVENDGPEHSHPWQSKNKYGLLQNIEAEYNKLVVFRSSLYHGMAYNNKKFNNRFRKNQVIFM